MTHNLLLNYGLYRKMEIYVSVTIFIFYSNFKVHITSICHYGQDFSINGILMKMTHSVKIIHSYL